MNINAYACIIAIFRYTYTTHLCATKPRPFGVTSLRAGQQSCIPTTSFILSISAPNILSYFSPATTTKVLLVLLLLLHHYGGFENRLALSTNALKTTRAFIQYGFASR